MTQHYPENNLLKEIEKGLFRDCYLIYNRKSTDEPDNQKNSIKYQKTENVRFAMKQGIRIAKITLGGFCTDGIISEKHSAFKENSHLVFENNGMVQFRVERPKFYNLIQLLNKGCFKGVIVLCWDRISRNKADGTIIRKLMKKGFDFRFVLATYDNTSAGALHMDIDGMFSEHHSRVTAEKVTLVMKAKREKGICTYKAPVGYLNLGSMDNKPFDQERAPIVKQLFELYSTGNWTLADLTKWAIDHGFTMAPMRRRRTPEEKLAEEEDDVEISIEPICRPPTYVGIHKILTNPFYTGKILGNYNQYVPSISHEPLISQELFDKVQIALNSKKISVHYVDRLEIPLRGFIRCEGCGRLYTPYRKKGIVYFGARCAPNCTNTTKSFNIDFIFSNIEERLRRLSLTETELDVLNKTLATDVAVFETNRVNELEVEERKKSRLREDLAYLRSNKLLFLKTGVYSPESYLQEEDGLMQKITGLQNSEAISDEAMHQTMKDIVIVSELITTVNPQYIFGKPEEKVQIMKLIFSELTVFKKELKAQFKTGIRPLAERPVPMGDPKLWVSELIEKRHEIMEAVIMLRSLVTSYNLSISDRLMPPSIAA